MIVFTYVVIWGGITTIPGAWVTWVGMFFGLAIAGTYGCGYLNSALILGCLIRK